MMNQIDFHRFQPFWPLKRKRDYACRDVALYAVGVGAAGDNAVDPLELAFVYHSEGQTSIKVTLKNVHFSLHFEDRFWSVLSELKSMTMCNCR